MEPKISRRSFLKRGLATSTAVVSLGILSSKSEASENPEDLCINKKDIHCYAQGGKCRGFDCYLFQQKASLQEPTRLKHLYRISCIGSRR